MCLFKSLKCVRASLRYLLPLGEVSVCAATDQLPHLRFMTHWPSVFKSKLGGSEGVAHIMLSQCERLERKQLHCNSSHVLNLSFDRYFC